MLGTSPRTIATASVLAVTVLGPPRAVHGQTPVRIEDPPGVVCGAQAISGQAASPPDLRLEWNVAKEPIEGRAGETVEIRYLLRNVGGTGAFAVVLSTSTALGPQGAPRRRQPGPRPGESLPLSLSLPLAEGMRELCIDASLQNLRAEDPPDPNPGDNRVCRAVKVKARQSARSQVIAPGAAPARALIPTIAAIPTR